MKISILLLAICLVLCVNGHPDRGERIVGGSNAGLGQIPYIVSLRAWGNNFHIAGGAIISNRWILTTANEVSGFGNLGLNIVYGIVSLQVTLVTNRRSDTVTLHPNFDANSLENNIACVRAAAIVTFTSNIQPITMQSAWAPPDTEGIVSGWGATDPMKGDNSVFLQFLTVRTRDCVAGTLPSPNPLPNEALNFCTEAVGSGGICVRDEGGPLRNSANAQLIGIASRHGFPCGTQADVFVRISAYRTWIGSVTGV